MNHRRSAFSSVAAMAKYIRDKLGRIVVLVLACGAVSTCCALDVTRVPLQACASQRRMSHRYGAACSQPASLLPFCDGHIGSQHNMRRSTDFGMLALSRGGGTRNSPEEAPINETPKASNVLSYYLLWSPGMFKKTVYSVLVLALLRLASIAPGGVVLQYSEPVLLPLLSSACCGIQLVINALVGAGGCAGFNKYLGPLRPYFLALLFYTTLITLPIKSNTATILMWTRTTVLRWFIALMPEMVQLWNSHHVAASIQRHAAVTQNADSNHALYTTIELTIPTMGCVACINKIDSSLRQCAQEWNKPSHGWNRREKVGAPLSGPWRRRSRMQRNLRNPLWMPSGVLALSHVLLTPFA